MLWLPLTETFAAGALMVGTLKWLTRGTPHPTQKSREAQNTSPRGLGESLKKGGLGRSATSAALATAADYLTFNGLLFLGIPPAPSVFFGCVVGGLLNFYVNRTWAYTSRGTLSETSTRYVLVSLSSAAFNTVGVSIWIGTLAPQLVWWVTRGLVFVFWNYPLHRDWVFKHQAEAS